MASSCAAAAMFTVQAWNMMLGPFTTDCSTRVLGACRVAAAIAELDRAAKAMPSARMAVMMMAGRRLRMAPPYQSPRSEVLSSDLGDLFHALAT
jgi:hypothetical protein